MFERMLKGGSNARSPPVAPFLVTDQSNVLHQKACLAQRQICVHRSSVELGWCKACGFAVLPLSFIHATMPHHNCSFWGTLWWKALIIYCLVYVDFLVILCGLISATHAKFVSQLIDCNQVRGT